MVIVLPIIPAPPQELQVDACGMETGGKLDACNRADVDHYKVYRSVNSESGP